MDDLELVDLKELLDLKEPVDLKEELDDKFGCDFRNHDCTNPCGAYIASLSHIIHSEICSQYHSAHVSA